MPIASIIAAARGVLLFGQKRIDGVPTWIGDVMAIRRARRGSVRGAKKNEPAPLSDGSDAAAAVFHLRRGRRAADQTFISLAGRLGRGLSATLPRPPRFIMRRLHHQTQTSTNPISPTPISNKPPTRNPTRSSPNHVKNQS